MIYGSKIDYLETGKVYKHYTTEESANASYLRIIGQRGGWILLGSYKSHKERPALTAEQQIYN